MQKKFDVVLKEIDVSAGLRKEDVPKILEMIDGDMVLPMEIAGSETIAVGFGSYAAMDALYFDPVACGLADAVEKILEQDPGSESEYMLCGVRVKICRAAKPGIPQMVI